MPKAQDFLGLFAGSGGAGGGGGLGTPNFYIPAAAAISGITALFESENQNEGYEQNALQFEAQKQSAAFNERLAALSISQAYDSGAYQAMVQGLSDAQAIANTRASRAGSGVRLGVGSAREVEASQRVNAAINQSQIQKSTINAATNAMLSQYNYKVQQVIAQGNADAARALKSNSGLTGLTSFITNAGMFDFAFQDGGKNKSPLASIFSSLF